VAVCLKARWFDAFQITTAPLIVIDGARGAQKFGTIALYELPARLLALAASPI